MFTQLVKKKRVRICEQTKSSKYKFNNKEINLKHKIY